MTLHIPTSDSPLVIAIAVKTEAKWTFPLTRDVVVSLPPPPLAPKNWTKSTPFRNPFLATDVAVVRPMTLLPITGLESYKVWVWGDFKCCNIAKTGPSAQKLRHSVISYGYAFLPWNAWHAKTCDDVLNYTLCVELAEARRLTCPKHVTSTTAVP